MLFAKWKKMELEFEGWRPEDIQSIDAPTMVMIGDADSVRPNTQCRCSACSHMPNWPCCRAQTTIRFCNSLIGSSR